MTKSISDVEAGRFGITTNHEQRDSGELRFRLVSNDGSGYIRTESGEKSFWQNSHYHSQIKEMYIVQKGWIAFAELISGALKLKSYYPNEYVISCPGVKHNLYMASNSVIHTVKFGETQVSDWISAPDLDELTKELTESEILS